MLTLSCRQDFRTTHFVIVYVAQHNLPEHNHLYSELSTDISKAQLF
jgi:hypothetical protein